MDGQACRAVRRKSLPHNTTRTPYLSTLISVLWSRAHCVCVHCV